MQRDASVIIVGGGPAGMATALFLLEHDVDVIVLEKSLQPHADPRAATYHPPTLEMLAPSGVTAELHARGLVARHWQIRDRKAGLIAEFDLAALAGDTPYPYRLQCEQHKLVAMLERRVASHPKARIIHAADVIDVTQDADSVTVEFNAGEGRRSLRAAWLVGADGGRSVVRKSQQIEFAGFTWPERFLVITTSFDFATLGYALSSYTMDPTEWTATFKIPGDDENGLWRCVFPTRPEEHDNELLDFGSAAHRLAALAADTAGGKIVHTNLYSVHQRVARSYHRGRVLLVGDAAHVNNPLGGMGLNFGLHDAHDLAPRLAAILHDQTDAETLLAGYDRRRRTVAENYLQSQTIANKRLLEENDPDVRRVRQDEIRTIAADPDATRRYLLRTSMIESIRAAAQIN